MNKRQTRLKG
uniref:Uncharacterized protein n=1 Tax=Arundo donax TaxID=35708 RepID=A0A0A9EA61_ARUDO